jgi:hypothetical protein
MRMRDGIDSSMMYLMYCNNFCKCHNVPPFSTKINKGRKKREVWEQKPGSTHERG